jgi:HSP20 family molecular chaperone IbpA
MIRAIPPRTMSNISRERVRGIQLRHESAANRRVLSTARPESPKFSVTPVNKPREWRYQTRPSFKRVRGPLVDVFNEAEEVLIVVDLGGFTRGEISLSMTPQQYILHAARGEQRFEEVIGLPPSVDVDRARERLVNGVIEIVLPRKKEGRAPVTLRRRAKKQR